MDHSESLWGIPTINDLPTSLDLYRRRRIRTLTGLNDAESTGAVDAEKLARARQAALRQFARADRAVARQQQRMLAARAALASAKRTNEAISAMRHELMAERHAQVRLAREAHLTRRRSGQEGRGTQS